MRGTTMDMLPGHIDEFVYRWNRPKVEGFSTMFEALLADIFAMY